MIYSFPPPSLNMVENKKKEPPLSQARFYLPLILALGFLIPAASTQAKDPLLPPSELGDDGLHKQPWFKDSFLDLQEDLEEAAADGKRLVIFWEQEGCPYCKKTHEVNLRNRQIVEYIKKNFHVIQLDLRGSREVTGFHGKTMPEKDFGEETILIGTPSIQFIVKDPEQAKGKKSRQATAWRFVGYLPREQFLNAFHYVASGTFKTNKNFPSWVRSGNGTLKLRPSEGP